MKRAALLALAVLALTGCTTLQRPEELTYQALHVVDLAQTLEIPGDPCLYEKDPLTSRMIGKNPGTAGVLAWGVAEAGLHLLVSDQLRAHHMHRAYAIWQAVSIGGTTFAVGNNHANGIRIGKRNVGRAVGCRP